MVYKLPKNLQKYFWDTDFSKLDPYKHRTYIIERLLEHGDSTAYRWVKENYTKAVVASTVAKSRRVGPRTKNFLQIVS